MPERDRNDARVTFVALCRHYGLTIEQTNMLWRSVTPPYPVENPTMERPGG